MKRLTAVQWLAVVVSVVLLVAFAAFIVIRVVSGEGLPFWALAGIAGFVIALVAYPLTRRKPRPPQDTVEDRKDPK